jgi:hypothetical protein
MNFVRLERSVDAAMGHSRLRPAFLSIFTGETLALTEISLAA